MTKFQWKTKRHKRKAKEVIGKPLKKLKRVGAQQDEWASLEEKGETPKAWQPKEKGASKEYD